MAQKRMETSVGSAVWNEASPPEENCETPWKKTSALSGRKLRDPLEEIFYPLRKKISTK